jgi:SRSO17 transposase
MSAVQSCCGKSDRAALRGVKCRNDGITSFVPETWTSNPVRLKRADVPVEYRTARTKPEIALAEIDRVIAAGVRFGCALADAGYGLSAP